MKIWYLIAAYVGSNAQVATYRAVLLWRIQSLKISVIISSWWTRQKLTHSRGRFMSQSKSLHGYCQQQAQQIKIHCYWPPNWINCPREIFIAHIRYNFRHLTIILARLFIQIPSFECLIMITYSETQLVGKTSRCRVFGMFHHTHCQNCQK